MRCRHCDAGLALQMADLGTSPPSNAFRNTPDGVESYYPLQVLVCTNCWLAQTNLDLFKLNYDELFTKDYPYYSSTSPSFVAHAKRYVDNMTDRFKLGYDSLTVEIGSNDGYLLQHVKTPCYGVEPTSTREKSLVKGIRTFDLFFSEKSGISLSNTLGKADLMVCNNVLAHVPDINDFVKGFTALLKDTGVATFEFPHLSSLIKNNQFDTIYHEHYSYLSLTAVINIFKTNGLNVFDAEHLPTHGGSLRVYAQKFSGKNKTTDFVRLILDREESFGIKTEKLYSDFQVSAERVKNNLLTFLLQAKQLKRTVVGFGAAAKGNTLLNFAGIRSDLLQYVVDDTPSKQGKFLPGSRIPVQAEFTTQPDYVLILPWNFSKEISNKLDHMKKNGTQLVTAVPQMEIF